MTKRILVVEDDLLNRMFICVALDSNGFTAEAVEDGAQVIDATRAFDPHLIVMDINLPNISGLELIKKLKGDPGWKHIPIMALTAYIGRGEEHAILKAGAAGVLAKPVPIKLLLGTIEELLTAKGD